MNWRFPGDGRGRMRVPILLLWLLLLTTLSIAGLTSYALKGQRAELEEARRKSQEQALALLATRVEQALLTAVQTPFLVLKNIPHSELSEERLRFLRSLFSPVREVLVLDREMALVRSFPLAPEDEEHRMIEWITGRMQEESATKEAPPLAPQSFVETAGGEAALFAFQPIYDMPYPVPSAAAQTIDGWILVQFDLGELRSAVVAPLLAGFGGDREGKVELLEPQSEVPPAGLNITLTRMLPGWTVVLMPSAAEHREWMGRQRWPLLAAAAAMLLAIAIISVALWWEIRREYALVDLRNRFVANISHELKTPLSLIRMYAETLYLRRLKDSGKKREYLRIILREAERLSRMINDVLDFARLREGRELYRLSEADLRATVEAAVRRYRPEWEGRGVRVDVNLPLELPPVAHDPQGVRQILLNLVDNAIKYAGTWPRVEVRLHGDSEWVELQVIDSGPGIPPAQREELRKSIHGGGTAQPAKGSGLGLALVEQIAEAHQAHFILDTADDGSGVKAVVSFPSYRGAE